MATRLSTFLEISLRGYQRGRNEGRTMGRSKGEKLIQYARSSDLERVQRRERPERQNQNLLADCFCSFALFQDLQNPIDRINSSENDSNLSRGFGSTIPISMLAPFNTSTIF
ncbi:hypothetical protein CKAN_02002200 [Cinnamomum micranthum f. kanehirae]|uniref:Uncharacterized protein n=1 Tax=Cinnamomum micranthum f. kanehirae TaxID=337451 RepID=A0A3S3NMX8_9MAGN|nr:hypothetical protein CKAN_02002200 [Cinnamomum micranthum f. kanehirae]